MALTFTKKAAASAKPAETQEAQPAETPKEAKPKSPGNLTFMKKGAAAKAAVAKEEAQAEARRAEYDRMWRFFLPYNEDAQITFLDGKLDEDGVLDIPRFHEHRVKVGADWKNYVCTAELDQSQPCPICESGDKPSLVGVMTIIDHREYKVEKGPNAGKVYKNRRKLYVAKEGTLKQLNKLASKPERNGLAGCTFDVSRGPENKHPPAVGDTYDFVTKYKSLSQIAEKFGLKIEDCQPAKYDGDEGEIVYISPAKLIEMGIGKAHGGVGYEQGMASASDEL